MDSKRSEASRGDAEIAEGGKEKRANLKPETGTHASGRWLGTKQKGGCAVGCIKQPEG